MKPEETNAQPPHTTILDEAALNALVRLHRAALSIQTVTQLAEQLRAEIIGLFNVPQIAIFLFHPESNTYRSQEISKTYRNDDPLVRWVVTQEPGVPLRLGELPVPDLEPTFAEWRSQNYRVLLPLGINGWLLVAMPTDVAYCTPTQVHTLELMARTITLGLERIAAREELSGRQKEMESIYWITQAVSFTMPLDDILELIYFQLKRGMPLPYFYVAFHDPEQQTLNFAFFARGDERIEMKEAWGVGGLESVVLHSGAVINATDYFEECRKRGVKPPVQGYRWKAWMGAPLLSGNQATGIVVAATLENGFVFQKADENFFTTVAAQLSSLLERFRLYDNLQRRARQLSTLNEIGKLLASSLDLDEVLDLVVKQAARLLDSEAGSLLLLDEASGDLIFRVSSGPAGQQLVGLKVPAGRGIAGSCFAENRPIIVNNTRTDTRWYSSFDQKSEFVTRSLIAVPLNARGRTVGVLEVINHAEDRPYTPEDVELLTSFASQAAIAIENARLFTTTDQALQARVEELMILQHIDRQLSNTLDYKKVMSQTLDWAVRMAKADVGLIALIHEEDGVPQGLQILAYQGYPDSAMAEYAERLWPLEQGVFGRTARLGEISLVPDVSIDPDYLPLMPDMRALLAVPIHFENRVIGLIGLEKADSAGFTQESVEFISRLADRASIAIQNARLFQQVQAANQAKTEFISFVSHELKQPMTSMKGYTDLLMKGIAGPLNEQQMQFLKVIRSNVGRMDEMVSELLDISRIESGRLKLNLMSVDPAEITQEVANNFRPVVSNKNQRLELDLEPGVPPVRADRGRLVQIISNLVSNANKYTPEGGLITIRLRRLEANGQAYALWEVQDTGIGMTPEEQAKLFTKYFRSANPAVRSVPGTGLGLVITRSIIEMHGGTLSVKSEPDRGSTFSFTIPLDQPASGPEEVR